MHRRLFVNSAHDTEHEIIVISMCGVVLEYREVKVYNIIQVDIINIRFASVLHGMNY